MGIWNSYHRSIGYQNYIKLPMVVGSLLRPTDALQNPYLTSWLTTVTVHFQEYCEGIFKNTGVNCFWIIKNSQQVLHNLQLLSKPL